MTAFPGIQRQLLCSFPAIMFMMELKNSANILQQLYVHKVATSSYLNTPLGPGRDPDKASPHSESSWSANPDDEWPPGNIEAKTENEVNAKSDETARQRALDIAGEVVLLG